MKKTHVSRETQVRFFGKRKPLNGLDKTAFKQCLLETAIREQQRILNINYILVDDEELLQINREHLQHDYYTDIITFDLTDAAGEIEGEIYISWERVADNAIELQTGETEMIRVLYHGALHLMGYKDKTKKEQEQMREKENECVNLYQQLKKQLNTVSRETHAI
jgi:rRNA maturation RNase YbeY